MTTEEPDGVHDAARKTAPIQANAALDAAIEELQAINGGSLAQQIIALGGDVGHWMTHRLPDDARPGQVEFALNMVVFYRRVARNVPLAQVAIDAAGNRQKVAAIGKLLGAAWKHYDQMPADNRPHGVQSGLNNRINVKTEWAKLFTVLRAISIMGDAVEAQGQSKTGDAG